MARTKATYRRSQARQRQRKVPGEPSTTSVKAASLSANSPSVAGASADEIVANEAAALLATNQPSDLGNDKETTDKPKVDTTSTMRETNV